MQDLGGNAGSQAMPGTNRFPQEGGRAEGELNHVKAGNPSLIGDLDLLVQVALHDVNLLAAVLRTAIAGAQVAVFSIRDTGTNDSAKGGTGAALSVRFLAHQAAKARKCEQSQQ